MFLYLYPDRAHKIDGRCVVLPVNPSISVDQTTPPDAQHYQEQDFVELRQLTHFEYGAKLSRLFPLMDALFHE
ncbi:hypothetical protein [Coxiella endosymbiont of Ornithodoros maritimus]|uniref:hypothetical protein n=1 Tax=Coxiella endosymbiont of Ornithodoros maritimus TaxID=1656172 RepID=UPI002264692E|nr:hypothetical protein [Coxiella endosymbiont of Ornithodoros maritimus]